MVRVRDVGAERAGEREAAHAARAHGAAQRQAAARGAGGAAHGAAAARALPRRLRPRRLVPAADQLHYLFDNIRLYIKLSKLLRCYSNTKLFKIIICIIKRTKV